MKQKRKATPMERFHRINPQISLDGDVAWILDDQINRAVGFELYHDQREARIMDCLVATKAAKILRRQRRGEAWVLKNAK